MASISCADRVTKTQLCRHCEGAISESGRRGLCGRCYRKPRICNLYDRIDYVSPIQTGSGCLPEPTDTLPGTPERVAVLEARASAGESLFHPDDRKREDLD